MQSDDPAFLPVGTEVSAKFKGAFCEAKVKKVTKTVKCKVLLKEAPLGSIVVEDTAIAKGAILEVNQIVEVTHGKQTVRALIQHIKDCSQYHVVFNDGDEKTLRRTQMCLKGGKHFDAAVNLDALPLYNPEQFGSPVVKGVLKSKTGKSHRRKGDDSVSPSKRKKRREEEESEDEKSKRREKRAAASAATVAIGEMDHGDTEQSEDSSSADSSEEKEKEKEKKKKRDDEKEKEKEKDEKDKKEQRKSGNSEKQKDEKREKDQKDRDRDKWDVGDAVCWFEEAYLAGKVIGGTTSMVGDRPQLSAAATVAFTTAKWQPAVVVSLKAYREYARNPKTPVRRELPVRSFQNGKYHLVSPGQLVPLTYVPPPTKKNIDNMSSALRAAIERANAWAEDETLPNSWTYKEINGERNSPTRKDVKKDKEKKRDKEELSKEERKEKKDEKEKKKEEKEKMKKEKEEKKERKEENEREKEREKVKEKKKEESKDEEKEKKEERKRKEQISSTSSSSDDSDGEPGEERDLFIAQLYKFHEERASPINRVPILGGKEVDFFNFYRIVQHYGGAKKVSTNNKWKKVMVRMKLDGCPGATPVTVRKAYLRYLAPYSTFVKTLGWTSGGSAATSSSSTSAPRGERRLLRINPEAEKGKRRKSTTGELSFRKGKVDDDARSIHSSGGSMIDGSDVPKSESPALSLLGEPSTSRSLLSEVAKEDANESKESSVDDKEEVKKELGDKNKEEESTDNETNRERKRVHKDSVSASKDVKKEKEEKREKRTYSMSESRKKDESSDAEPDDDLAKRKKEKKKLSMRDKTERRGGPSGGEDKEKDDEGYSQANILSHFYMGQKVRANHTGRWYDARVVEVKQPTTSELGEMLTSGPLGSDDLLPDAVTALNKAMLTMKCYVHYLGWNSRYDEWISLEKLRISRKDMDTSLELVKSAMGKLSGSSVSTGRLMKVLGWSAAIREREKSSPKSDDHQQYRPRRLSTAAHDHQDGHKKEVKPGSSVPTISTPAEVIVSPPPVSLPLLPSSSSQSQTPSARKILIASPPPTVPSTVARQSLSPSMYQSPITSSSPSRLIPQSNIHALSSVLQQYQQSPGGKQMTVREVAASAAGLESRARGSRSSLIMRSPARSNLHPHHNTVPSISVPSSMVPPVPVVTTTPSDAVPPVNVSSASAIMPQSVSPVINLNTSGPLIPLLPPSSGVLLEESIPVRRTRTTSRGEATSPVVAKAIPIKESLPEPVKERVPTPPKEKLTKEVPSKIEDIVEEKLVPEGSGTETESEAVSTQEVEKSPTFVEPASSPSKDVAGPGRKTTKRAASTSTPTPPSPTTERRQTRASSRKDSTDDIDETLELELEEEARKLIDMANSADSDAAASGSETPQRTDNEDNVSEATSSTTTKASSVTNSEVKRMMSPGRGGWSGRGMKRKRAAMNRHSNMVVDRKYMRGSKGRIENERKDDDSDQEEEDGSIGTVSRDTFMTMKHRMHRQMEAEGSLQDFSPLGIVDFNELLETTAEEELIEALENRLQELRDIYITGRQEISAMEKLKRKHAEKKRERERTQRRSVTPRPSLNATPISTPTTEKTEKTNGVTA